MVAPTQVPTTEWGGGYRMTWDGTSAATPHVAGTAALVLARAHALGVRLSAGEVMQIIRMTADDLADPAQGYHAGWDLLSGWGRTHQTSLSRANLCRWPSSNNIQYFIAAKVSDASQPHRTSLTTPARMPANALWKVALPFSL